MQSTSKTKIRRSAHSEKKGERLGTSRFKKAVRENWQLYVLMLPAIIYTLMFCYKPMYGILMAFQRFSIRKGIWGSEWVGFLHFERLFSSSWFPTIIGNTLIISLLSLAISFPLGIVLALLFNEVRNARFRKTVQTISYAPHFISTVVMCGMITMFLDPRTGIINRIIVALGGEAVYFMQSSDMFKWVYVLSGLWQGIGWSTIIYYAALSNVDKTQLEAAEIDGASRFARIRYINIPTIMPTIVTMFILSCGNILSVGYEKAYLLQNDMNLLGSELISTYVYKVGIESGEFSFSTAVGLFNTVINCTLLILANTLSKKITKTGLM